MSVSEASVHVASLEEIKGLGGLEFLRRIADGRVPQPPIAATLGFRLAEVAPGFALFTMVPEFRHYNPIGTVHGGVASTLLDSCMSCAIQTHLEKGTGYTTPWSSRSTWCDRSRTRPDRCGPRAGRCTSGAAPARPRASSLTPTARCSRTAPRPA